MGRPALLVFSVLLLAAGPALAHVTEPAGGFASGFSHPLKGADHVLAMFAVGLWGAQMGGRTVWTLPATFPLVMAAGALAGMLGLPLPAVQAGIAGSVVVLGAAIAYAWRPAEAVALAVIGTFAVFHGHAHGIEMPRAVDPADYAIGFVVATGVIHLGGIGIGLALGRPLGGWLARGMGVIIAGCGGYFLVA
jgi:urease accessory protein